MLWMASMFAWKTTQVSEHFCPFFDGYVGESFADMPGGVFSALLPQDGKHPCHGITNLRTKGITSGLFNPKPFVAPLGLEECLIKIRSSIVLADPTTDRTF